MNVLHLNASDVSGGAARAAYRIHRSIVAQSSDLGICSRMRVGRKFTDDITVFGGPPVHQGMLWPRIAPRLNRWARLGFLTDNPTLHSIAWPGTGMARELQRQHRSRILDLVHLHWLGDTMISIEEIGCLQMPVVWTLHDQWAFCGAEHYTAPPRFGETASSDERFLAGYIRGTRPANEAGPDLNRSTWLRKHRAWKRPMHIVCPSRWMAECAGRSMLLREWPITVIPYPIDTVRWAPFDKRAARGLMELPQDKTLLLFGAIGGTSDPRKGADLLMDALRLLIDRRSGGVFEDLELVIFGQGRPSKETSIGFPIHYAGSLQDDISLRLLYAAADAFVIPSRQDNLPNTGIEAMACGTPVVAFSTGGLPDLVSHCETGWLARPFEVLELAQGINWVLQDRERNRALGERARVVALERFAPGNIAAKYSSVYQAELSSFKCKTQTGSGTRSNRNH